MKKYLGLIAGLLPLFASAQVVMSSNFYITVSGGTQASPSYLVVGNSTPAGITNTGTAWIVSEGEFNMVDWNIGTSAGKYLVPFGYSTTDYIPLTFNVITAGAGSGMVKFSTYHGSTWNNALYKPSDVTSMTDFGAADYSADMADRFWIMDANTGYSTKPSFSATFTYLRGGATSEIAVPNNIIENAMIAQRFNSGSSTWNDYHGPDHRVVAGVNTGTVSSDTVSSANFFRSWTLANDSNLILSIPTENVTSGMGIFPNPTTGDFQIQGMKKGSIVQVYDYTGKLVKSQMADNSSTTDVNLSTEANGVYLIRILSEDGSSLAQKKVEKVR